MRPGEPDFPRDGRPRLFAILNLTPDSFHARSRLADPEAAAAQAARFEAEGADVLDLGAESSRPGSDPLPEAEELRRLMPALAAVRKASRLPLSIDTSKAAVAEKALKEGAAIINDITAFTGDSRMADLAAASDATVILMHMQGTPKSMQDAPVYADVLKEVGDWLLARAAFAEKSGVRPERIILDPGIGFGKTLSHNLALIRGFPAYIAGRFPVLIGHSRKRFTGDLTGRTDPADRLFASLGAAAAAAEAGARFLRVHDVRETRDMLLAYAACRKGAA